MFQTYTYLSGKDIFKIVLFLIGFCVLAFFTSRLPDESEESPYERVRSNVDILLDDFPEDALNILEAYVYQYTDDYRFISQSEADAAYDTVRRYCYSFYDVLD